MIDWNDYYYFALIADEGSYSQAALRAGVSKSVLSRRMAALEERLGVRLIQRTTRRLALTAAGEQFAVECRALVAQGERARAVVMAAQESPQGMLRVSAPVFMAETWFGEFVSEFIARYPLIRVRLLLSDRNADLVSDHVDLAVRIGDLADSSMVATRLGTMRIVACAHPALLAKYGEPQRPRDLAALPIIRIESPMPYRGWRFRAAEREDQLINLPPMLSVTTPESAADAARLGVGVARLLHYQALDGLRHGELRLLLENVEPDPAPVHLLYTARDLAPLKLRKFIDFAAPALRQALLRIAGAA